MCVECCLALRRRFVSYYNNKVHTRLHDCIEFDDDVDNQNFLFKTVFFYRLCHAQINMIGYDIISYTIGNLSSFEITAPHNEELNPLYDINLVSSYRQQ